jgi:hypothetical protein
VRHPSAGRNHQVGTGSFAQTSIWSNQHLDSSIYLDVQGFNVDLKCRMTAGQVSALGPFYEVPEGKRHPAIPQSPLLFLSLLFLSHALSHNQSAYLTSPLNDAKTLFIPFLQDDDNY